MKRRSARTQLPRTSARTQRGSGPLHPGPRTGPGRTVSPERVPSCRGTAAARWVAQRAARWVARRLDRHAGSAGAVAPGARASRAGWLGLPGEVGLGGGVADTAGGAVTRGPGGTPHDGAGLPGVGPGGKDRLALSARGLAPGAGLSDVGAVPGRWRAGPGWRCRRSERVPTGWVDLGAGAAEAPRRRGDRTGAGTPGDKTDSVPPGPRRAGPRGWLRGACGTAGPARLNGPAARQAQHGSDPVTLTPYAGRGVQQRVIRTLEGGGGREGGGGGGGGGGGTRGVETTCPPQQGLPHTDIAPPLTHRPARPALSPCPDGPPSPHRPDPAPNVSAPSHEAHRPHRRPQSRPSSPRPTHTDRLCQQATAASRLPTDQATNHARPNPQQEATARSPVRRRYASPTGRHTHAQHISEPQAPAPSGPTEPTPAPATSGQAQRRS